MVDIIIGVFVGLALLLFILRLLIPAARQRPQVNLSENYRQLLTEHVPFYNQLEKTRKKDFESRIQHFLSDVRITGVKTEVSDLDRVLVAASAIIPIFGFPGWEYPNLNEVLLYPETFGEDFAQTGQGRNILGMVGSGAMQNVMILSQHELMQGFINKTGKSNTAIHEFVHLVDKTDGAVDGIPENLMERKYVLPWLQLMHKKIAEILKGKTDINPYGATSEGEFFAVVSEYFFERPDLLQQKHPELFQILVEIFNPHIKNTK